MKCQVTLLCMVSWNAWYEQEPITKQPLEALYVTGFAIRDLLATHSDFLIWSPLFIPIAFMSKTNDLIQY